MNPHIAHLGNIVHSEAARLGEVFDSVVIVVSHREGSNTIMLSGGSGNHYARMASVQHFLAFSEESIAPCQNSGD